MSKDVNNISNRTSVNKALSNVDLKYKQDKIKFALEVNKLNTSRVQSEEEMEDRIQKLFELCSRTGNIPTYESLAVACGIPIRTFYDMSVGKFERICRILADYQKSKGYNFAYGELYGSRR